MTVKELRLLLEEFGDDSEVHFDINITSEGKFIVQVEGK